MRRALVGVIALLVLAGAAALVLGRNEPRTVLAADDVPASTTSSTSSTTTTILEVPTTLVVAVPDTTVTTVAVSVPATTVRLPVRVTTTTTPPPPKSQAERMTAVAGAGLYLVDVDGANLRRLYAGPAGFPAWSPDGSKIAYTVGNSLWVTTPDAIRSRVADSAVIARHGPSWSADSNRVAFVGTGEGGQRDAWVATTDGAPARRIVHAGDDAGVGMAPDGRLATMGMDGAFITDDNGATWRRLGDATYNFGELLWSPNGTRLAAIPDSFPVDHVFDLTAGTTTAIGGDEPHRIDGASWCADNQHLVLEGYYRDRQIFGTWLASAAGGSPSPIGENDGDATCIGNDAVLAVQQGGQAGRSWAIVMMGVDGSNRRAILTYGSDGYRSLGHPRLSPDGRTIAFIAYR